MAFREPDQWEDPLDALSVSWGDVFKILRYIDDCVTVERRGDSLEYRLCDKTPTGFDTIDVSVGVSGDEGAKLLYFDGSTAIQASRLRLDGVDPSVEPSVNIYVEWHGGAKRVAEIHRYVPGTLRRGRGTICVYFSSEGQGESITTWVKAIVIGYTLYILSLDPVSCM